VTEAPPLKAKVADALDNLRSLGIELEDAEIVWLAELRNKADTPPGREIVTLACQPLTVCGVTLWPLHMLAEAWFAQWFAAFEDQTELQVGVYLYAHVYSKPGDRRLIELTSMDTVQGAVSEWLRGLPVHGDSLQQIVAAVYRLDNGDAEEIVEDPTRPTEDKTPRTLEDKVASLCRMFEGTTPTYWQSDISKAEALRMAANMAASDGGSNAWAESPIRARRVANYLNAVKQIARRGMETKYNG